MLKYLKRHAQQQIYYSTHMTDWLRMLNPDALLFIVSSHISHVCYYGYGDALGLLKLSRDTQ